jgi:uncharacterized protein (UPF0548 family)
VPGLSATQQGASDASNASCFNDRVRGSRNGDRIAAQLAGRVFTYQEVGATTSARLPVGYRQVHARAELGAGRRIFDVATDFVCSWSMHRAAGLKVFATSDRARPGVDALLELPIGPVRISAPVRVVYDVAELDRRGFAYGSLDGHPESGEEAFVTSIDREDVVHLEVIGFSKPVAAVARLGGPISRYAQDRVIDRYVRAVQLAVRSSPSTSRGESP